MNKKLQSLIELKQLWNLVLFLLPINKRNKRCNYRTCAILIFLAIYIVLIIVFKKVSYTKQYESKIIFFMTNFNLATLKLLMMIVLLNGIFRWKLLLEVKEGVKTVDEYIRKMHKFQDLFDADHHLRIVAVTLFALSIFTWFY